MNTMNAKLKKTVIILVILVAAAVAALVGAFVYEKSPAYLQRQLSLGDRYLTEDHYEKAMAAYNRVLKIDPKNQQAISGLADAYVKEGDRADSPEKAAAAYRKAFSFNGADLNIARKAASSMAANGDYEQALYLLLQAMSGTATDEDVANLDSWIEKLNDPEKARTIMEIILNTTGDQSVFRELLYQGFKSGDQSFLDDIFGWSDVYGGMDEQNIQDAVQKLMAEKDTGTIDLAEEYLKGKGKHEAVLLAIDLWKAKSAGGEDGVKQLLETYYQTGKSFPDIPAGGEIYYGDRDADGKRSGYGICFYGAGVKPTSMIYAGYWKDDVRSGEGRAYKSESYRIDCSWENDYPEGEVTILQEDKIVKGSLAKGHVMTEMVVTDQGGNWVATHCIADASMKSGYAAIHVETPDRRSNCPHVQLHTYCWDCSEIAKVREGSDQ